MRFLFVTDERFHIAADGDAFSSFPHQLSFIPQQIPGLTELRVFTRVVVGSDVSKYYPIPPRVGSCDIFVVGPRRKRFSVTSWPWLFATQASVLRREVRQADIVFVRIPNMFPSLACRFLSPGQLLCAYVVGNPRETIAIMLPRLQWISPWVQNSTRRIAARADVQSFVSRALESEYGDGRDDALITNANTLRESQIIKAPRLTCNTPPVVTFVGRISPEKGLHVLIESMARVLQHVNARLHLVGDGPIRPELERQATDLGLEDKIVWHGWVPHGEKFFKLLRESDTFVLPSFSEGMPTVLVEAMSQGLPIVASRVGGIPDQLQHGAAGLLTEPGDAQSLAAAILRTLTEPALRKDLIQRGLEVAREGCMDKQAGRMFSEVRKRAEIRTGESGA